MNKKAKKNALKQAASSQHALDPNDQAALNRRAERFQREHELERTKHLRIGGQASLKANQQHAHLFNNLSRSGSPLGSSDDPEADPVCISYVWFKIGTTDGFGFQNVIYWDRATIVGTSQEIFKDYLRLTTVSHRPCPLRRTLHRCWDIGTKTRTNTAVCHPSTNSA